MRLVREDFAFGGFEGHLDLPCFVMRAEVDEYHDIVKDIPGSGSRERHLHAAEDLPEAVVGRSPQDLDDSRPEGLHADDPP